MTLVVVPDPGEPHGGFAFLRLPEQTLEDTTVYVRINDSYGGRWLMNSGGVGGTIAVDDGDWGTEPHSFGPYVVERKEGYDWVRIGPEIVNRVSEFMPIEITVGSRTEPVTWPDNVIPRAAPALAGGMFRAEAGVEDDAPGPEVIEPEEAVMTDPVEAGEQSRRAMYWVLALAVIVLGVLAVWFLTRQPAPADQDIGSGVAYERDSGSKDDPCGVETLTTQTGGFAITQEALVACGAKVSPDTALTLIERAATKDDPAALLLMGKLYDAGQTADGIEDAIGLTFEEDLTRSVEYYARAQTAGAPEANELLAVACTGLQAITSTLAKGAFNDYCQ